MNLEIISRSPRARGAHAPLLFVHGACCGAWVWDEHFLPYFAENGYEAHAFSLRGHGESARQKNVHLTGLADYVRDLDEVVRRLGAAPILVGHSLGGVVVQKWLQHNEAPAAVFMGSGPPHGMLPSTIRMLLKNPLVLTEIVLAQALGPWTASAEAARKTLFSDSLPAQTVRRHFSRWSAESLRVGLELVWPNFPGPTWNRAMPVFVLGAEKDFFVSPTMVEATAQVYGTRAEIFPDMAHAMMLEPGWRSVADRILLWIEDQYRPEAA